MSALVETIAVQLLEGFHANVCDYRCVRRETILAGPGAAGCCYAEDLATWHVVGYGFLLYRVYMASYDFAVDGELQFSGFVASNAAEPNLASSNVAVSGTGGASHSSVR